MSKPIVSLKDVTVEYRRADQPPITALTAINLRLHNGEKVAVFGPNGSGKSTLLRIMAGLERPTSGEVTIFGVEASRTEPPPAIRQRIGFVMQNPEDMFATESVADEIRFALECRYPDRLAGKDEIDTILSAFGLADLAGRPLDRLSGGEKQKAALASVLAVNPEVIFFDEPTSYLDPPGRREFLGHPVFSTKNSLSTTVLVTQYWEEAEDYQRVLVLEKGRIVFDGPPLEYAPRGTTPAPDSMQLDNRWIKTVTQPPSEPLVKVENLNQTVPVFAGELVCPLRDISFAVGSGERVGLIGPTGAGKSTLAYHLAGLMPNYSGTITVVGRPVPNNTKKSDRPPVALLFQNPDHHLFAETVTQDVAFGPRNLQLPQEEIETRVYLSMEMAGLPSEIFGPRSPFEISGGEQRKAALAGTLALPAVVYIFDEPTAYLDLESTDRVEALINALSSAGKAVIVISHDLPFVRRVCPRWLLLDRGRLIYDGGLARLSEHPHPLQQIEFA